MDHLPLNDIPMLVSSINFLLRDEEFHLDCFRVCEECGHPMIEGYVVDGCDTYCSKECLHKHITEDEFNAQYNNEDGNTYWTTWYEDSLSYNIDTNDAKGAFPNAAFYK